jgi:hypothetical protein
MAPDHHNRTSPNPAAQRAPIGTYVRGASTHLGAGCDLGSAGTMKID